MNDEEIKSTAPGTSNDSNAKENMKHQFCFFLFFFPRDPNIM